MAASRGGFALTDGLAVGVAAIVAAGAGLPALTQSRSGAMGMTNKNQHRLLAAQQSVFMDDNNGRFTGPNVTGWPGMQGVPIDADRFLGETTPSTPTQAQDWITPLVGDMFGFSANRAKRTQQVLDVIRDPRNTRKNDVLFANGSASDTDDFLALQNKGGGFYSTSYLSPAAFQMWGTPQPSGFVPGKGNVIGDAVIWMQKYGGVPYAYSGSLATTIKTPRGYRPRIDMVGATPSEKVMFADGTRYLENDNTLDIETSAVSPTFGNFLSGFFSWEGETSYGRQAPGSPGNISLSFRSNRFGDAGPRARVFYTTRFDGSTRVVSLTEAKSRPDWWAPTGSEWVSTGGISPEIEGMVKVGDHLP